MLDRPLLRLRYLISSNDGPVEVADCDNRDVVPGGAMRGLLRNPKASRRVTPLSRTTGASHMAKATWNGTVIAESDETVVVEGNHYFPPEAVRREFLVASEAHTILKRPWRRTMRRNSRGIAPDPVLLRIGRNPYPSNGESRSDPDWPSFPANRPHSYLSRSSTRCKGQYSFRTWR